MRAVAFFAVIMCSLALSFGQSGPTGTNSESGLRVSEVWVMDDGFFVKFENSTKCNYNGFHIRVPLPTVSDPQMDTYKSWLTTFMTARVTGATVQVWRNSGVCGSYAGLPTIEAVKLEK